MFTVISNALVITGQAVASLAAAASLSVATVVGGTTALVEGQDDITFVGDEGGGGLAHLSQGFVSRSQAPFVTRLAGFVPVVAQSVPPTSSSLKSDGGARRGDLWLLALIAGGILAFAVAKAIPLLRRPSNPAERGSAPLPDESLRAMATGEVLEIAEEGAAREDPVGIEATFNQQAGDCLDRFAAHLDAVEPQKAAEALQDLEAIVSLMERRGYNTDQITKHVFDHLVEDLQRLIRRIVEAGAKGGLHANPVLVEMTVVLLQSSWMFLLLVTAGKKVGLSSFFEFMIQVLGGVQKDGQAHYFRYGFRFYVPSQNNVEADRMRKALSGRTPLWDLWEAARGLAVMLRHSVETSFNTVGYVGGDDLGSLYWAKRIFTGLGEGERAEEIDAFMNERHRNREIFGGVEDG